MNKHRAACPQKHDALNDCMCDYIKPRSKNGSHVTSKTHVRKLALANADPKFRRVGQSFYDAVERQTASLVMRLASAQKKGVTLK